MAEKLALYGGDPIRSKSWPKWPLVNKLCIETLTNQLLNNRWAISGAYDGKRLWNEKFSKAFCKFNGSKYCVTTSSGSTSIISTLEALNIGYGDSVIIPALTWVADAASVLNVNARPILADCNPKTLCIDSESIDSVIENDTKAVIIVHLYSSICDLDSITKYCRDHNLLLIEDCAHVHGAKYKNIGIGNFGICGIFSMQQTKVLTSGEGGCVVTNDIELHEKLQEVRTDGRILNENIHILNELQLEEKGQIMGTNYSLSEVQAVLLYYGLKSLKRQLLIKNKNVKYFKSKLKNYPGISFQETNPKQDGMIYYALPIRFDKSIWPNVKIIKEAMDSDKL